jgi:hypothetical protein
LKFLLALSPTELDFFMPMAWHVVSASVIQKKKIRVMNRVGDRDSAHPIHPVFIFFGRGWATWPFVDEEIGFVRLPPNTHEAFWKGLLIFTIMGKVNHFYCLHRTSTL